MVESNGQDAPRPWFSGLGLTGEVAAQYEMERDASQQEGQDTTKAGLLELDGLAPITIFVGANNSGKSRLLRELFKTEKPVKFKLKYRDVEGVEMDIGSEIQYTNRISGIVHSAGILNCWFIEDERRRFGDYLVTLDDRMAKSN